MKTIIYKPELNHNGRTPFFITEGNLHKPVTVYGKNMVKMLTFACQYPGWHSINMLERETREAARKLVKKGLIEMNEHNQIRVIGS